VIVHPPGGIAGGDRLSIEVDVEAGAHAFLTTPGATKWYKAPQGVAVQTARLRVAAGAVLEWLPQEAIVFNAADADSRTHVDLSGDARFIGWDILCFGRTASDERFATGRFRQRWELRRDGALLWNEFGALDGGSALMDAPVGMAGQPVVGTLIASGPDLPAGLMEPLRERLSGLPCAARVAATRLDRIIAVRYLGPSTEEARDALTHAWSLLRQDLTGVIAEPPRLWRT
jgi:urease accessory protein